MRARWKIPIAVTSAVVAAAIVGGFTVYSLASRIGESDRAAIASWEMDVASLIASPRPLALRFDEFARHPQAAAAEVAEARAGLDNVRRRLPEVPTPPIMRRPTESVTKWMFESLEALVLLERAINQRRALTDAERAIIDRQLAVAEGFYAGAREAVIRLRCRARFDDCERTELPA